MPPFEIPRIPVTSLARFTSPVVTAPPAARNTPLKFPIESEPKKPCVDDAYVAEICVADAFVSVSLFERTSEFVDDASVTKPVDVARLQYPDVPPCVPP